jgi:glycosyltransferase involved in cell wall biosynthesis
LTGPVNPQEIPAYIAAMDIAVQPNSTEYASPMKMFEYMAMRKCVVAPDQPNIREIVDDGITGFLFKPGDKEALKAVLRSLANDPARREAVARKAYERIFEQRCLWRFNAQRALALLSQTHSEHDGECGVEQSAVNR